MLHPLSLRLHPLWTVSWYTIITRLAGQVGSSDMESIAYILILTLAIGVLFFAIAFREPPRIDNKDE